MISLNIQLLNKLKSELVLEMESSTSYTLSPYKTEDQIKKSV